MTSFKLLPWIIFAIVSCVNSEITLQSSLGDGTRVCPGDEIIFTCETVGSSLMSWSSDQYIGTGGTRLEFALIDAPGSVLQSRINSDVFATLNSTDSQARRIVSTLHIITSSDMSNPSVTCVHRANMRNEPFHFQYLGNPDPPNNPTFTKSQDELNKDNCIISVEWSHPVNTNESDISHYIIESRPGNIRATATEKSVRFPIQIPDCAQQQITVTVLAVNRCGYESGSAEATEQSQRGDVTGGDATGGPNSQLEVILGVTIGSCFVLAIMVIILCFIFSIYKFKFSEATRSNLRGHKVQAHLNTDRPSQDSEEKEPLNKGGQEDMDIGDVSHETLPLREYITIQGDKDGSEDDKEGAVPDINRQDDENGSLEDDEVVTSIRYIFLSEAYINKQMKRCLQEQSKHEFCNLGTEEDQICVPIWIDDTLDDSWKHNLQEAVRAINEAAPGLSLLIEEDKNRAIVYVLGTDKEEAYTEGNILMRWNPRPSGFITKIYLGKWEHDRKEVHATNEDDKKEETSEDDEMSEDDRKKGISIHELLHALGFHHERQCSDPPSYVYPLNSGKKITINKNWLSLTPYDFRGLSIMWGEKSCINPNQESGHLDIPIWLLESDKAQQNIKLSEMDKVGLNLVYPPCICTDGNVKYEPKLSDNGMYYCGRPLVVRGRSYPYFNPNFPDHACGPNNGPNCPACRTIRSPKVKEILDGGRWQGMAGLVYCGRQFADDEMVGPNIKHNGMCGIDNGGACPDCNNILNRKMETVSTN